MPVATSPSPPVLSGPWRPLVPVKWTSQHWPEHQSIYCLASYHQTTAAACEITTCGPLEKIPENWAQWQCSSAGQRPQLYSSLNSTPSTLSHPDGKIIRDHPEAEPKHCNLIYETVSTAAQVCMCITWQIGLPLCITTKNICNSISSQQQ